jgi:hypothetical protein
MNIKIGKGSFLFTANEFAPLFSLIEGLRRVIVNKRKSYKLKDKLQINGII